MSTILNHVSKGLLAFAKVALNPKSLYFVLNNNREFQRKVGREFPQFDSGCQITTFGSLGIEFPITIKPYSFLGGTSSPIDLALLKSLSQKFDGCKYMEIGTWRGESVMNLAPHTDLCVTINFGKEKLKQHGYSKAEIEAQNFYVNADDQIQGILADSQQLDFKNFEDRFDLIFIDGDHHWKQVSKDTGSVFNHLLHEKSIVVWHDYMTDYSRVNYEVLYGILKGVPEGKRHQLFHVYQTNCLAFLPFDVEVAEIKNPYLPVDTFTVEIDQL